jgi:hypothetical protein
MAVRAPRRLVVAGLFLQSFGASWGSSKASMTLQLSVERQWLLLKLIGWFNRCEDRRKIMSYSALGFWFWWLEIGADGAPFYRGFVLMSYPRWTPCHFISKLTSNREELQQIEKGEDLTLEG